MKPSLFSVILKNFGITTGEYKRYSQNMQMALDACHLDVHDFIDKYFDEVTKVFGYVPDDSFWYDEIYCCMIMCSTHVCSFTEAYKLYQEDFRRFFANMDKGIKNK